MISQHLYKHVAAMLVAAGTFVTGCTALRPADPVATGRREVAEELPGRLINGLSVKEMLEVSGVLASDLSSAAVIQQANRPVVLEIVRLEDGTAPEVRPAPHIYAATIREKLLNMGHGTIAFRDKRLHDKLYIDTVSANSYGGPERQKELSARLAKLAKVDYYLSGFVYKQDEVNARTGRVLRYYRVHFLLTDATTGLIAWEKHYDLKNEGVLIR